MHAQQTHADEREAKTDADDDDGDIEGGVRVLVRLSQASVALQ